MLSDMVLRSLEELKVLRLNPCSNGICSLTLYNYISRAYEWVVLILVLMEYALWRKVQHLWVLLEVLILVLMEYALWHWIEKSWDSSAHCLNPCSNGICSLTSPILMERSHSSRRLNPCSNGICSLTMTQNPMIEGVVPTVLILVLMEYALWHG